MNKAARALLVISHIFTVLAILTAAVGCWILWIGAVAFACFDSCSTRDAYFARVGPGSILVMAPSVALAALALALFVASCLVRRQRRVALLYTLVALVIGLVGVAALYAFQAHAHATLPVTPYGLLDERAVESWGAQWALACASAAAAWATIPLFQAFYQSGAMLRRDAAPA